jgi:hypothetical protein
LGHKGVACATIIAGSREYDISKIKTRGKRKFFRKRKFEGEGSPAEPVAWSDRSLISEPHPAAVLARHN